jgi:aminoglycoside phosphotransferase (APT) family kinase protein
MPESGELIASGRAADVYACGDGNVLRRYRTPHDCLYEAAVMQYVREHGYPAPEVVEVAGPDIVMERIEGPTMLQDFSKRPWRLFRHARTLADLYERLHAIPPPSWMRPKLGGGAAIVHLDLHPLNVIISSRGPVVIDWTNAGLGVPAAETADLWLIMSAAEIPGSAFERALLGLGRGLFLRAFLKHFDLQALRAQLPAAAEHRLRDRNILDVERERIGKFVERWKL